MTRLLAIGLVSLAGCWRGDASEPAPAAPAPVSATPTNGRKPSTGPSLTSFSPGPLTLGHAAWDNEDGCLQCHLVVGKQAPLDRRRCLGCHDHDDLRALIILRVGLHADPRFGDSCEKCHHEHRGRSYDNLGWHVLPGGAAGFDHALTGWPIPLRYRSLTCVQCHQRRNSAGYTVYVGLDPAQWP